MAWVSYISMVTICRIHVEEIFAYKTFHENNNIVIETTEHPNCKMILMSLPYSWHIHQSW
jgi:hypothetical protein